MKKENGIKRKQAAALSYDPHKHQAPILIAKGSGKTAEAIIEKAEENHIPIQEDPNLVELLCKLELSTAIPEELYQAVAEVFAFIYRLDKAEEEGHNE
ncbi:EscU/YscU/HrcU family type III secretion system export apparatus switch protein [Bacillus smithii]|jgi:flagellar biosynthesis protein|uniref:EscU/YscU/HrcU family type III secretion system export apparatus switch protein n=1 Tax=Bacillus smithii TaxID=1479 RepID=UPI003D199CB5